MILAKQDIIKLCEERGIVKPFIKENVNPASLDLTIGNKFIMVKPQIKESPIIDAFPPRPPQVKIRTMEEDYPTETVVVGDDEMFIIPPLQFVLATTQEFIDVPVEYAVYVEGRSSIGRMGLQVQNAGFIDPGFKGKITLELFNASNVPIAIKPGRRVCQFVFFQLSNPAETPYEGKYMGQSDTTISHVWEDREVKR